MRGGSKGGVWAWPVALSLLTAFLIWAGRDVLASPKVGGDFLCYWGAGKALASGASPYDTTLQARIQGEEGWDKTTSGLGIYDCVPYYYPPWVGLFCVLLLPLGYTGAKLAWFSLNVEATFLSGYLLGGLLGRMPRWVPVVLVPAFLFTVIAVLLGQPVMLMFFLAVLCWRLLEQRWDRAAGMTLVWLTYKPQLSALLVLGLLLWAIRRRRWGLLEGFLLMLAVLSLGSALLVPRWPLEMWRATSQTPPPTHYFPWIGTTWLLLLESLGLHGRALWAVYLAAALPSLGAVLAVASGRDAPLSGVFTVAFLAAFFVAPYARHYDFPVLLIPLLVLLRTRLRETTGAVLLAVLVIVPYLQFALLQELKRVYGPIWMLHGEWTFFWVPVLLTAIWVRSRMNGPAPGRVDQAA